MEGKIDKVDKTSELTKIPFMDKKAR